MIDLDTLKRLFIIALVGLLLLMAWNLILQLSVNDMRETIHIQNEAIMKLGKASSINSQSIGSLADTIRRLHHLKGEPK